MRDPKPISALVASLCCLILLGRSAAHAAPATAAKPAAAAKDKPGQAAPKSTKPRVSKQRDAPLSAQARAAIDNAKRLLASSKREDVEAGIQSLGLLGTKEAVEPLAARIRDGLPPDLLQTALVTLTALSQPNAGPVLFELCNHRRPEVRLRAVEAIAATRPSGAESALIAALSDGDPKVRSAAATGLGELGARNALEKLFLALDRGNLEASGSIGKVIAPNDVERLVKYIGQLPFHHLGPALAVVFQRADVAEQTKLALVARLEEVGTSEIKGYLNDLVSTSGASLPPAVSRAVLRAMQEIAD